MLRNEFVKLIIWPMLVSVAFVISAPALLHAQTVNGTIMGTVVDEGGGVLPGADVEVRNLGTGLVRTTLTNDQGQFRLPNIPLGGYYVSASIEGFQTQRSTDVKVTVGQRSGSEFLSTCRGNHRGSECRSNSSADQHHVRCSLSPRGRAPRYVTYPLTAGDWAQLAILAAGEFFRTRLKSAMIHVIPFSVAAVCN